MKTSLALFLAKRFYRNAGKDSDRKASLLAIRIATAGVALGLAVMIVSICVVKGFQSEIRAKLAGFSAHLEIMDRRSFSSPESFPILTDRALTERIMLIPGVKQVQRASEKMGILKTNDAFQTIMLKGVGPDYDTNFLKQCLVEGRLPRLDKENGADEVLLSRTIASSLGLKCGDRVYTYFVSDAIRLRRFTVVGIYETNLSQFDEHLVWTDRHTVNQLNDWSADQSSTLEIFAADLSQAEDVQVAINRLIGGKMDKFGGIYDTLSLNENPTTASVMQWLSLLDFNVWVILALMLGVAGFTTISGLLILILERTRTIGILKSLGASNTRVRYVFLAYATLIVIKGMIWGNVLGIGFMLLQHYFGWVKLDPATYYVSAVPVEMNVWWITGLNIATLLISILALIIPSFLISRIQPARAIRYE